jgi:hypothetical protein
VTPFWMRETLEADTKWGMGNMFLRKTASLSPKSQNATARCGPQGELTSPTQSVLFHKGRTEQVARFSEKVTRHQPITNSFKED